MSQLRRAVVICFFLLYTCSDTESAVLIADFSMTRMIELFAKRPYCKLHTDRGDIQRMLLHADPKKARQVSRENLLALEEVCLEAGGLSGELQGGLGFIYPGTKWCGPGNIASEYSDLGRYAEEDKCCREHDLCPHTLSPGECKRGLCNSQAFTRSHCDCDAKFRRCLQGLNTETANTLGAVFFNVVQVTCFKERRPCSVYQSYWNPSYYNICPWEYVPSDLYTSSQVVSLENEIFPKLLQPQYRSFNDVSQNGIYNPEAQIRLASLGLIAKSLFKDLVVRQVGGLYQLYTTAKDILEDRAGYNKTVTDELCSQWKYRPSEKYISSLPYKSYK